MTQENVLNGINVDQLMGTIDQVKENPAIARFQFRAANTWVGGTHNQATVKDYYGALQEDTSRQQMAFDIDEPPVLCGRDIGANPAEYLLMGLSGCLTTSMVAHAAAKGIQLKKVSSRYEGDLDLQGFMGLSDQVPVGFKDIRVYFDIEADLPMDQKQELIEMAKQYSPVFNSIHRTVPVSAQLEQEARQQEKAAPA